MPAYGNNFETWIRIASATDGLMSKIFIRFLLFLQQ